MSKAIFDQIEKAVKAKGAELVKMGGAVFQLVVGDGGADGKLCIDLKNGTGSTKRGDGDKADVTITMADADFVAMASGKLDGMQAFMSGKLKVSGNMMLAQKLGPILESAQK
mmetsp:Transcript_23805/g.62731  ORF Transcript_23805/g.62731 Transcript_23805/m.62731 type:complete len:112 (+) Transcript_23805:81-416(+)